MSLSKNKISYIQSLKQKKQRTQHQTFVAEGSKLIYDLLPHMRCQLLVIRNNIDKKIPANAEIEEIVIATAAEMKKASHLATPPDALAVFYQTQHDYSKID